MRSVSLLLVLELSRWLSPSYANGGTVIPTPSGPQYRYQSTDFVALIHFNMATFAHNGDPGCDAGNWDVIADYATGKTRDPATFNPKLLNTTQWMDSITALGANIAVLTAKHGCGFTLWPTNAKFDDGTPYGYNTKYDLVAEFVTSAKAAGVGYGFYYSIMKSFYLCRSFYGTNSCIDEVLPGQYNVSDDEYANIVEQHVRELWTNYGNFSEIWVDSDLGGFGDLMVKLQPNAEGSPAHPRMWCGTESGYPTRDVGGGPIWQTGLGFHGNSSSLQWVDKFCDPQLFRDHIWFWQPNLEVRTLKDMIPIYHDIVGRGMVMELAFSIDRNGLVDPEHEVVYKQLGDWVRSCYGQAISSVRTVQGSHVEVNIPPNVEFDRIMIQEDISWGQRIRNYTVSIGDLVLVPDGNSVGRKRIHVFPKIFLSLEPRTLVLNVTNSIAIPKIAFVGIFEPCFPDRNNDRLAVEARTPTAIG